VSKTQIYIAHNVKN